MDTVLLNLVSKKRIPHNAVTWTRPIPRPTVRTVEIHRCGSLSMTLFVGPISDGGYGVDTVGYSHVTDFNTPGCRTSSRSYSQQYEFLRAAGVPVSKFSDTAVHAVVARTLPGTPTAKVSGTGQERFSPPTARPRSKSRPTERVAGRATDRRAGYASIALSEISSASSRAAIASSTSSSPIVSGGVTTIVLTEV